MARSPKTSPKAGNTVRVDRKQGSNTALSSASIAADLAAFRKSGGKIEVLGNTLALKKAGGRRCRPHRPQAGAGAALSGRPARPARCPNGH